MKNLLKLTILCAILFEFAVACTPENDPQPQTTLTAPAGLDAIDITTTTATLKWSAVEGAGSYLVKINDGTPVAATGASHPATGLTAKTEYTWAVQALNGDIKSEWSANRTFTTAEGSVGKPSGLKTVDVTSTTAKLEWNAVTNATGYDIKIGEEGDTVAIAEGTTYGAGGLIPGTEYIWYVRGTRGGVVGEWAASEPFSTEPLDVPSGLAAADVTHKSAILSWSTVDGATGYEVRIDSGDPVAAEGASYKATGLTPDADHVWTVRAVAGGKVGDWAPEKTFTTASFIDLSGGMSVGYVDMSDYGAGTTNFVLQMMGGNPTHMAYWDIIAGEIDRSPGIRYFEIPVGEYTFSDTKEPNTVYTGTGGYTQVINYSTFAALAIADGTMTVEGDAYAYIITFYLTLEGGENIIFEYTGSVPVDNPNYIWKYDDLLGSYTGSGTAASISGQAPGASEWNGRIEKFADDSTDRYTVTGNFGGCDFPVYMDVQDRVLYIDNETNVGEDSDNIYRMSVAFISEGEILITSEARFSKHLVWNPVTGTITYPLMRNVAGYGSQLGLYGISAFNKTTGRWSAASEFYSDIVLTLDGAKGAATFSGAKVKLDGISAVKMLDPLGNAKAVQTDRVNKSVPLKNNTEAIKTR